MRSETAVRIALVFVSLLLLLLWMRCTSTPAVVCSTSAPAPCQCPVLASEVAPSLRLRTDDVMSDRGSENVASAVLKTPVPRSDVGKTAAHFLMFVEDRWDDEEVRKQHVTRLRGLGFLEQLLRVDRTVRNSKCPEYRPLWAAATPVQTQSVAGAISVVSTSAAAFYGSEHLGLIRNVLNAAGGRPCVAIDVGANEGAITTWLGNAGCRVFSYEALRSNWRRVYTSIQSNADLKKNVQLYWAAISDSCGTAMSVSENNGGADDMQHQRNGQVNTRALPDNSPIYTRRIDDDVDEDVLLIKIDVEGFEPAGLAGAIRLLRRRNVPFIHSEFSPSNTFVHVGPSGWLYMLAALDYEIYLADCQQAAAHVFAKLQVQCSGPDEAELVNLIVAGKANTVPHRRIHVGEIESFVKTLNDAKGLVNLIFFNRNALVNYKKQKQQ